MEFIIVIIILALVFDYINGFHDAANSIATIVSTKVLTPFQAVIWAAFFNMIAFFIFQDHAVANTIGKTVNKEFITLPVIFAGLIAAIIWESFNLVVWYSFIVVTYVNWWFCRCRYYTCIYTKPRTDAN
jgi:PiT family inorganic phosphate transporter